MKKKKRYFFHQLAVNLIVFCIIFNNGSAMNFWKKRTKSRMEVNNKIIEYGTKEFIEFESKAKVKAKQAWEIHVGHARILGRSTGSLYVCINEDYLFSTYHDKINNVSLWGYYVDSQTGEVEYIHHDVISEEYGLKKIEHFHNYKPEIDQ